MENYFSSIFLSKICTFAEQFLDYLEDLKNKSKVPALISSPYSVLSSSRFTKFSKILQKCETMS